MKHLDFTIDFETVGLTANAAPMQVAIVPWRRDANDDPFVVDDGFVVTEEVASAWPEPFVKYVDLRTCVVDGFDFDTETVQWWAGRSEAAKDAVCRDLAEPVADVFFAALDYIRDIVAQYQLNSICLWSQGMDFDIAILRNLCKKYDVALEDEIPHTSFRDCRTLILEVAAAKATEVLLHKDYVERHPELSKEMPEILSRPELAYKLFGPLPDEYAAGSEAHDALYDATRSSWYTWQSLKCLRQ